MIVRKQISNGIEGQKSDTCFKGCSLLIPSDGKHLTVWNSILTTTNVEQPVYKPRKPPVRTVCTMTENGFAALALAPLSCTRVFANSKGYYSLSASVMDHQGVSAYRCSSLDASRDSAGKD